MKLGFNGGMGQADGEPHTAIRTAAMAELAATGVDDFTLDGVAKRAGVDVKAIVAHWHDRRVLLMEAMLLLATVAQRYRLLLAPGAVVKPQPQTTLRPAGGLPMLLQSRTESQG